MNKVVKVLSTILMAAGLNLTPALAQVQEEFAVNITEQEYACGVNAVKIEGMAQYPEETNDTKLEVTVNGEEVLQDNDQSTEWSVTIPVVAGDSYEVVATISEKEYFEVTLEWFSEYYWEQRAQDVWEFAIEACPAVEPIPGPAGPAGPQGPQGPAGITAKELPRTGAGDNWYWFVGVALVAGLAGYALGQRR